MPQKDPIQYRDKPNVPRICKACGQPFFAFKYQVKKGFGNYCSRKCGRTSQVRENHYNWKGGKYISTDGYVYLTRLHGVQVAEHRAVMESIIGRPLRSDEVVHHINGIRTDNRPENLQLLTPSQHSLIHVDTPRRPNLHDRWSFKHDRCIICGTTERKHYGKGMCRICWKRDYRKRHPSTKL